MRLAARGLVAEHEGGDDVDELLLDLAWSGLGVGLGLRLGLGFGFGLGLG